MIKKPTWIIHGVGDENTPLSYHTHGLDKYGSLELEINLNIQNELAGYIINEIGLKIANGEKIMNMDIIEDVVTAPLVVVRTKGIHSEEEVLRIIIPDENLKFPWEEGCSEKYIKQVSIIRYI